MELIKDLFVIVLLLSASAFCISAIFYLLRITKAIEAMQGDLNRISDRLNPVLDSFHSVSRSINRISEDVRNQLSKIEWIIDEVRTRVEGLLLIERRVMETVENPVQNILSTVQGIKNGVTAFLNVFKK